ncbi:MAG: hypothetical protein A2445_04820 [Candidatus Jacksonbacteria bacterium RIFOXYC2_FULL_44_29]|nr:MAG: Glycosyl transferase family 2 [Parcubacteria group bacterium GW2011_GWC2_44_22]OGY75183.1 MAG: hypothetical protein A2240_01105 [Candidatus Jacksonbacteria bacterium RIFOXYA2_FULL_43_12]OGY75645.1 MAG: hypothetical protein A2295_04700 [Candidatus Jacksonbacteria bacterium RIFOXYB2_FULL_44_15]OGY77789.1 MAG: hypothetical protein A2445_04820 [Candidatus Jacksonbacteria bacterium RIFOXYC2_FULL_44_29]OGY79519.1 MAG: hypothetical protein A2550_02110 [Candidatus Jacksonbacteria bacterium RIFO
MKIYTIIPAYNESSTIESVIRDVHEYCHEIVVVDDGSTDNTTKLAAQAGAVVLHHIVNRGQGAALQTGISYALRQGAEAIVTFDADGQHRAEDINVLIKPIQEKRLDVVLGSRFLIFNFPSKKAGRQFSIFKQIGGVIPAKAGIQTINIDSPEGHRGNDRQAMPWSRYLILKLALLHQRFFAGLKVTDTNCGLRAFSRRAAQKINITSDRMAHASQILEEIGRLGLTYQEVPVNIKYTTYSRAKGQKNLKGAVQILYEIFIGRMMSDLKSKKR